MADVESDAAEAAEIYWEENRVPKAEESIEPELNQQDLEDEAIRRASEDGR